MVFYNNCGIKVFRTVPDCAMWPLVLLALAAGYLCYRLRYRRLLKLAGQVPSWRRPLPLIGNLHQVYGDSEHAFRLLVSITEFAEESNSAVKIWFGPCLVYYISRPDDIKAVTSAYAGKPFFYEFARPWVAEGLVTASVPVWKKHVRKLAPTFAGSVVDGFLGVFDTQTRRMVEGMRREVGGGPFVPLRKYLAPTTLEIVCQTALGVPDMSGSIVTSEYMDAFHDVLRLTLLRGFNPLLHPDVIYSLTPNYRRYRKCLQILHKLSSTVVKKRREQFEEKTKNKTDESKDTGPRNFKAFLDLLLELPEEEKFTEDELRAEVDTIIVGGQETTASTLQFVLLLIGGHPEVQARMYAELKEIFGDTDRRVQKEDLRRMVYAEAVIRETLRLYPPAPAVMRQADHELQLDGYTIPSGAVCVVCLWGAGRSRRWWGEDATLFRPERWLQPDFVPQHATYVPFSYGKRVCIGRLYAIMVLKTALANILRTFKLKSDLSKLRFKLDLVLRPIDGHQLEIELR